MVNTFLILLSYCMDLCTFVLLCQAPEIASHGIAEQFCCNLRFRKPCWLAKQERLIVGWSGFAPSLQFLNVAFTVVLRAGKLFHVSDLTDDVLKHITSNSPSELQLELLHVVIIRMMISKVKRNAIHGSQILHHKNIYGSLAFYTKPFTYFLFWHNAPMAHHGNSNARKRTKYDSDFCKRELKHRILKHIQMILPLRSDLRLVPKMSQDPNPNTISQFKKKKVLVN